MTPPSLRAALTFSLIGPTWILSAPATAAGRTGAANVIKVSCFFRESLSKQRLEPGACARDCFALKQEKEKKNGGGVVGVCVFLFKLAVKPAPRNTNK